MEHLNVAQTFSGRQEKKIKFPEVRPRAQNFRESPFLKSGVDIWTFLCEKNV